VIAIFWGAGVRAILALALCVWLGTTPLWPTRAIVAQAASAQPTGVVFGRVVDGTSGQPLSEAVIGLLDGRIGSVITEASGEFAFFEVRPGSFQLIARKSGYVLGEYGVRWAGNNQPSTSSGWHYPEAQLVSIAAGETKGPLEIRLWKFATILGRVIDEAGDPVVGVTVEAWPRAYAAGHPWLNRTYASVGHTDDLGVFRMFPLMPGDYALVVPSPAVTLPADRDMSLIAWSRTDAEVRRTLGAYLPVDPEARSSWATGDRRSDWRVAKLGQPVPPTPSGGSELRYPTTFYPAATAPDKAALVTVGPGEVHPGVDLQLLPTRTQAIFGTLAGPAGAVPPTSLVLYQLGSAALADVQVGVAFSQADGRFAFFDIPPGSYRLEVTNVPLDKVMRTSTGPDWIVNWAAGAYIRVAAPRADRPTLWANVPVTVGDADVRDLRVSLQTGTRVIGHIEFDSADGHRPASLKDLELEFDRADGRTLSVQTQREIDVAEDGSFQSVEVAGGKYFIRASRTPAGWSFQSATWRGKDVSVVPLECPADVNDGVVVVLTDRPAEVSGTVTTRDGAPDPTAAVMIFPRDPEAWIDFGANPRNIVMSRVDTSGRYVAKGLPPGEYLIVAVDDALLAVGVSPEFLGALSRDAKPLRVTSRGRSRMDLVTQVLR
jgi:hypothetical protein